MTVATQPVPQAIALSLGATTVHKFGGTSVGGPAQFVQVRDIVCRLAADERPVVVVSAMAGVTTKLYSAIAQATEGSGNFEKCLNEVADIHFSCLSVLGVEGALTPETVLRLTNVVKADMVTVTDHLNLVVAARHCPELIADVVAGHGEVWSAQIVAALISAAGSASNWVNARDFLFLSPLSGKDVRVDWKRSHAPPSLSDPSIPVVTGFLATSASGLPTTLKRNGSDHSGAIVANLCSAAMLTIWTDVDGIFSADPRIVPEARMIPAMSYKEAAELAYFGAKVIHPQTVAPCVAKRIPVVLRNTFNVACAGTSISAAAEMEVRAVTSIPQVALINVEGSGLFGFSGIAAKLFAAVAAAETNVIMITQASSEYSICFAVPVGDAAVGAAAVRLAFQAEIAEGVLDVTVDTGAAIVAAVGDGMHRQLGFLGRLATALGEKGVNIRALAQGSSERNITFVLNQADTVEALRSLHAVL